MIQSLLFLCYVELSLTCNVVVLVIPIGYEQLDISGSSTTQNQYFVVNDYIFSSDLLLPLRFKYFTNSFNYSFRLTMVLP